MERLLVAGTSYRCRPTWPNLCARGLVPSPHADVTTHASWLFEAVARFAVALVDEKACLAMHCRERRSRLASSRRFRCTVGGTGEWRWGCRWDVLLGVPGVRREAG